MQKWILYTKKADFYGLGKKLKVDPVLVRLMRNRNLTTFEEMDQYLNGDVSLLHDGQCMADMETSVQILLRKIADGARIRIMGDYDVDGIMSSYILCQGFRALGAHVDVQIPHRITDGYGISEHMVREAAEDGIDTIVTCDNGIAAAKQIAMAKTFGMTVIVTDHHAIPYVDDGHFRREVLPPADAIVNPHRRDCPYPFKDICGAVVAWKLVQVLWETFGKEGALETFLPFAAIATVCDVMDLTDENRIIVKEGLKALANTDNPGLLALIELNHLDRQALSAYSLGFVIGPCLNASGRLDTAVRALNLLLCNNREEALTLAGDLVELNKSRKEMTEHGVRQARYLVETTTLKQDKVLVIYLPECHESIAGIIAGKIREAYYRPVFILTNGAEGVKGSGRSIEGYSMYDKLVECSDLLTKFGGHPMAAGLSLEASHIDAFRRRLNERCELTEEDLREKVYIDINMPISYVMPSLVEQIHLLEPFGKGNTKPIFAEKGIRVLNSRILGKNRNVLKLQLLTSDHVRAEGIYFGDAEEFDRWIHSHETMSILYYPTLNTYMGNTTLQMNITGYC